MTDIQFGRLVDLPLRDAWPHEAHQFTPWLSQNIDHLSEVIGIPLELTGTEVAVESFSADILARNPMDDTTVLIENQLETTDHTHLGQIMTYLAGLEAQTVVWIAPAFREPHLSAIRWLNEHTSDGFSFFAVKARVVRIGDSPFAPIFEVVEKPNGWERRVMSRKKETSTATDELSDLRQAFWDTYIDTFPEVLEEGFKPTRAWNSYSQLPGEKIWVSVWIGERQCGIYVGGARGADKQSAATRLGPMAEPLAAELEAELFDPTRFGHVFGDRHDLSYKDRANWPAMLRWLEERRQIYLAALSAALDVDQ
ncbi:hypothetical protein [Pseudooceanicola algae]|uniref:DUF4268 domain-containing protein n=1 Tax=Pseudooceanicola algae TaxID=1537215 RepID=A0A418SBD1_9RHOB|nr:hypothetical protein [Pseudooceanicola algae]QPM91424.1 hypothetical protein PSAL_026770 [Pseudooceanicola algae]